MTSLLHDSDESMIAQKQNDVSAKISNAVLHPADGITGIVDEMLVVCSDYRLKLEWEQENCRVHALDEDWSTVVPVPLKKSVFRAVLARVAVLCDELSNTTSLYGGQGEVKTSGANPSRIRVKFENSPEKQQIQLEAQSQNSRDDSDDVGKAIAAIRLEVP